MIVKVQLPVAQFGPPLALIYNKDRTVHLQVPVTDHIRKKMGFSHKQFFKLEKMEAGEIKLGAKQPWQEW